VAESKGTLFLSAKLYADKELGADAVQDAMAQLSDADRELLDAVVAVGWYPLEPIMRFHHILDRDYGRGDLSLCYEIGRFAAAWQLNAFHKFVLKFKQPRWMLQKASSLWSTYHDSGRWEVGEPEPGMMRGCLYDFAIVDPAFCKREMGWFARAIELTGGKLLTIDEPRCRSRGDEWCEYVGHWS